MISSLAESMRARLALYAFLVGAAVLALLPLTSVSAATSIGNNVSVGGTLSVTGLSTLTGGFISSASSTVVSSLNVSGNLNVSSTLFVAGNILPEANNTRDLGAYDTAFNDLFSSGTLYVNNINGLVAIGSSTLTGLAQLPGGYISNASSSIASSLNVSGNLNASSSVFASGLATFSGRMHSSASSTFQSSVNITGNLNVSSTHFIGGNLLVGTNNTYNIGAMGNALAEVYVSSALYIGGNGSSVSSSAIRGHISLLTAATDLAATASSTDCTSSSLSITGVAMGDTMSVSPLTWDNAFYAGQLSIVPSAANTAVLMYCAGGGVADDRDPASIVYRIDIWKH